MLMTFWIDATPYRSAVALLEPESSFAAVSSAFERDRGATKAAAILILIGPHRP